jgi:hypothetical protein
MQAQFESSGINRFGQEVMRFAVQALFTPASLSDAPPSIAN